MKKGLSYLPAALALLTAFVMAPVLALATAKVDETEPVIVVAGPGGEPARIIHAAGGWVVGPVNAPFGALGFSDLSGFAEKLKANGAWAVLDGRVFADLCGVKL